MVVMSLLLLLKIFVFVLIYKNFLEIFGLRLFSEFLYTLKLFIKLSMNKIFSFSILSLIISYIIVICKSNSNVQKKNYF